MTSANSVYLPTHNNKSKKVIRISMKLLGMKEYFTVCEYERKRKLKRQDSQANKNLYLKTQNYLEEALSLKVKS